MKIAHISDLHLDKTYKRDNYHKTVQLLEFIADNNFDHVIISGDITENAEASAFEIARNLFKKFGLLNSSKLTLAIGNHDIYGGVHLAEDVINYPKKCKATNYEAKVNEFGKYFTETFTKTLRPTENELFPNIKVFDEFILININSIARYSMIKNPFASNGKISHDQLKAIEKLFGKNEFKDKHRIVITHHHFNKYSTEEESSALWKAIDRQTMKLRKKKSIIKQFKNYGVNLVLHGHVHESSEYYRKNIIFINAGGSILNLKQDTLQVNSLTIEKKIANEFITFPAKQKKTFHINEFSPVKSVIQHSPHLKDTSKDICLN